jgi:hypothetical protein
VTTPQLKNDRSQPTAGSTRDFTLRLFSFPAMCMALLSAVLLRYCIRGIAESDIWWVLRNAQHLLNTLSFPRTDSYSFTAAGSPWLDKEWLSGLVYFLGYKARGLQGILLVYFSVLVLIYIGVYRRCCRAGADCKDAIVATLAAICLGGVSIAPRTLLFGWLCMTGLLLLLDRSPQQSKSIWLIPPLFALWINLHGSWVFGMVVLAVTIASGFVDGEWGQVVASRWTRPQLTQLLSVFLASVAALFVNPFGYKLVLYPFDLGLRQQSVVKYMDEWQPVDFSSWNGKLAMLLILGLLAAALFSRRKWKLADVVLTSFALWAALSHTRFMFFAGLIIMPILAPRLKLFEPYQPELEKPWLNAAIIAVAAGLMIFFLPSNANLQQKIDAEYPKAALAFMQANHINGRVFNQYKFGGYMDWHAPELKPFIDGRADIFVYNGVFDDFVKATTLSNSLEILDKYKIDYVLYEPKQPLTYLLEHSPGWRLLYSDNSTVLFQRVSPMP